MSQTDIESLRARYEAYGCRDWAAFFCNLHPDFELKTPDRGLGSQIHRGPREARRAFDEFFQPFEQVDAEAQDVFESGDRIVVFFRLRSRPRGSSAIVEIRGADLWTMRDGMAARLEIFPQREKALKAAGLKE